MNNKSTPIQPIVLLISVLLAFGGGFAISQFNLLPTGIKYPTMDKSMSKTNGENIINFSQGTGDGFTGQITTPNTYFVSSGDTFSYYASTGGMAPPTLILNQEYQILPPEVYPKFSENNCILMWSTNSIRTVNGYLDNRDFSNYTLSPMNKVSVGSRMAEVSKFKSDEGEKIVGFLPLNNPERSSYFFETCNLNNESDLISVMKSLKLRLDVDFD